MSIINPQFNNFMDIYSRQAEDHLLPKDDSLKHALNLISCTPWAEQYQGHGKASSEHVFMSNEWNISQPAKPFDQFLFVGNLTAVILDNIWHFKRSFAKDIHTEITQNKQIHRLYDDLGRDIERLMFSNKKLILEEMYKHNLIEHQSMHGLSILRKTVNPCLLILQDGSEGIVQYYDPDIVTIINMPSYHKQESIGGYSHDYVFRNLITNQMQISKYKAWGIIPLSCIGITEKISFTPFTIEREPRRRRVRSSVHMEIQVSIDLSYKNDQKKLTQMNSNRFMDI